MPLTPFYKSDLLTLYNQDAETLALALEPDSVDCGLIDIPYFNLCHYRIESGEIGLEKLIGDYLANIVPIFSATLKAFKEGGVLILVVGDPKNNLSPVLGKGDRRQPKKAVKRRDIQPGFNEKEQLAVPETLVDIICDPTHEKLEEYLEILKDLNLKIPHILRNAARDCGWKHRHTFIWDKISSGAQYDPDSDSAPVDYAMVYQLVKYSKGGRLKVNCKPFKSSFLRYRPVSHPLHPCPLPPGLCNEIVSHIAKPGDTFLDLFAGSGATLKAAAQHGCQVIGNDLNPEFCKSIAADFDQWQLSLQFAS